jgi:glycopeptide antibiotics resistance protein
MGTGAVSPEVKKSWIYIEPLLHMPSLLSIYLDKHWDNFTLYICVCVCVCILKLERTLGLRGPSASYIAVSYCDVQESKLQVFPFNVPLDYI